MKIKDYLFLVNLKEFLLSESTKLEEVYNAETDKSKLYLDYAVRLLDIIEKIEEED